MYYYDRNFISRFKKAWGLKSFRKGKKEIKSKALKLTKIEIDGNDAPPDFSDNPEKEMAKTEKELMREKAHEIMKSIETRNSELSSDKDNDTRSNLSSDLWPIF
jgi:hypothetical protein